MKIKNFSKILALALAIIMTIAAIPFGVSADNATPEGTPITTAAEFAAMEANGKYYLANDIILTSTYANEFTGIFDGNGKTITTSRSMFDKVTNGTVKNFTVNGTIRLANGGAAVCNVALGSTFENITSNASITSTNTTDNHGLAAIVGTIAGDVGVETTITIENCVNTGNLKGDKAKTHAGAMIGYAVVTTEKVNIVIKNCRNEGDMDASKSGGMISYVQGVNSTTVIGCHNSGNMVSYNLGAGIVAQITKHCKTLLVENCTNSGNVSGTGNVYNGGIVGICQIVGGSIEYTGTVTFRNCTNSGTIIGKGTGAHCGGIVGRHYGAIIEFCGNEGTVENAAACGGIVGHTENANLIRYCYNKGTVKGVLYSAGVVAVSKNPLDKIYGCYNSGDITMMDGYDEASYNIAQVVSAVKPSNYGTYYDNFSKAGMVFGTIEIPCVSLMHTPLDDENHKFIEDDLASGKLAFDINNALGETKFYQNLNGEKDTYPVPDSTRGAVIKMGNAYYNFSISTNDTAATSLGNNGLKFTTAINKSEYDALIAAGINVSDITVGTMITLDSYITAAFENNKNFNIADFDDIGSVYINSVGALTEKDGGYVFEGSVVNIPESKLDKVYCAIGYVKIGEEIYYSATYAERSVADVAEAAYSDRADAQSGEYTNAIAANSSVAIGDTASYSPYTEAQLTELKARFEK